MQPSLRHLPRALRTARQGPRAAAAAAQASLRQQPAPSRKLSTTSPAASSSVNETEISHFSALASSWWDPHGPSRPLHLMNPLRHDFIQSCLSSPPPSPSTTTTTTTTNPRYLDVGCGGGIFAESAARLATTHSVTAIDPSATILSVARAHARRDPSLTKNKLVYLNETIESLPLPLPDQDEQPGGFDIVSLFEVLEHVDYPSAFLERVGQFVRPGGWLVLSTIARTWTSWVTTNVVAEDILGVVPPGTHDWYKYINAGELREWFERKNDGGGGREGGRVWGVPRVMGVVFVPGLGWKEVRGSEKVGNYFLGVQRVA
ncbi:S-adenosyl-L-methionine-dependent methyltransferase [Chaetomidium leptoderma]|uniref:Ubiquinone biosynthesis O-methyltransferase, mitochondrial n=1 Tax=Chaetomidium leptoderma TaxID=669021 RepID=A0AAN6ZWB9_9PEZI|nr:S-adenosyl-L-methionine-dependent methyltransferase [Chaetomidium leptoderma]